MNEIAKKSATVCVRCFVAGQVQGVFFRASTRHQAQQLGLTGYVKNLHDGRVEVIACGETAAIEELRAWLSKGPTGARVSGVACEFIDFREFAQFTVD
jgi:acylphosphatase